MFPHLLKWELIYRIFKTQFSCNGSRQLKFHFLLHHSNCNTKTFCDFIFIFSTHYYVTWQECSQGRDPFPHYVLLSETALVVRLQERLTIQNWRGNLTRPWKFNHKSWLPSYAQRIMENGTLFSTKRFSSLATSELLNCFRSFKSCTLKEKCFLYTHFRRELKYTMQWFWSRLCYFNPAFPVRSHVIARYHTME